MMWKTLTALASGKTPKVVNRSLMNYPASISNGVEFVFVVICIIFRILPTEIMGALRLVVIGFAVGVGVGVGVGG